MLTSIIAAFEEAMRAPLKDNIENYLKKKDEVSFLQCFNLIFAHAQDPDHIETIDRFLRNRESKDIVVEERIITGTIYFVYQDYSKVLKCFYPIKNHPIAMYFLGMMSLGGKGVPKSNKEAQAWFEGAGSGFYRAQQFLKQIQLKEDDIQELLRQFESNINKAQENPIFFEIFWWRKLRSLTKQLSHAERVKVIQLEPVVQSLVEASAKQTIRGIKELSNWYQEQKNFSEALECYSVALNHGFLGTLFNIGIMYLDGIGVPRDLQITIEYWNIIVECELDLFEFHKDLLEELTNHNLPAMKLFIYETCRHLNNEKTAAEQAKFIMSQPNSHQWLGYGDYVRGLQSKDEVDAIHYFTQATLDACDAHIAAKAYRQLAIRYEKIKEVPIDVPLKMYAQAYQKDLEAHPHIPFKVSGRAWVFYQLKRLQKKHAENEQILQTLKDCQRQEDCHRQFSLQKELARDIKKIFNESFFEKEKEEEKLEHSSVLKELYKDKKSIYCDVWAMNQRFSDEVKNEQKVAKFRASEDYTEFKQQMEVVVTRLQEWCKDHEVPKYFLWKEKEPSNFLKNVFNEQWLPGTRVSATLLYSEGKRLLEKMLEKVQTAYPKQTKTVMSNLCPQLTVCAPGVMTNLQIAYSEFSEDRIAILCNARLRLLQQYAQEFSKTLKKIPTLGMEIHYVNGLVNYVADHYSVTLIEDESAPQFQVEELNKFVDYLKTRSFLNDFLEVLVDKFEEMIREISSDEQIYTFTKRLDTLGKDQAQLVYDLFGYEEVMRDEAKQDYDLVPKPRDELRNISSEFKDNPADPLYRPITHAQLRENLKRTLFTRLRQRGDINDQVFVSRIYKNHHCEIVPDIPQLSMVKTQRILSKKENVERDIFFLSYLTQLDKDNQVGVLNALDHYLTPLFLAGCAAYLTPETISELIQSEKLTYDHLYVLALKGCQTAVEQLKKLNELTAGTLYDILTVLVKKNRIDLIRIGIANEENPFYNMQFSRDLLEILLKHGWRHFQGIKLAGVRLAGLTLQGDFTGADFRDADFTKVTMQDIILHRAILGKKEIQVIYYQVGWTNFSGLNLAGIQLTHLNLEKANFTNANLAGANFSYCYIPDAIFTNANLQNANFEWANLHFEGMVTSVGGKLPTFADFSRANLLGANFASVHYPYCIMENAKVDKKVIQTLYAAGCRSFCGVQLHGEDFSHLELSGARITGMRLVNPKATLQGVNLKYTWVDKTLVEILYSRGQRDFCGINLWYENLSGLDLSEINLTQAYLKGVCFMKTKLNAANFTGAYLGETNFSHAELKNACLLQVEVSSKTYFCYNLYAGVPLSFIKYCDGNDPLGTCKRLLKNEYLLRGAWGRLFYGAWGRNYVMAVKDIIKNFNHYQSIREMYEIFSKQLNKQGKLYQILSLCARLNQESLTEEPALLAEEKQEQSVSSPVNSIS